MYEGVRVFYLVMVWSTSTLKYLLGRTVGANLIFSTLDGVVAVALYFFRLTQFLMYSSRLMAPYTDLLTTVGLGLLGLSLDFFFL